MTARAVAAVLGVIALALAAVAGSGLLSSLYASAARDTALYADNKVVAVELSAHAVRFAPWRPSAYTSRAVALAAAGRTGDAIIAAEAALDPANAHGWMLLVWLRGTAGQFDERLTNIYRLAQRLAPQARTIQERIALDGAIRWRYGDEALRALWLDSMAFMLRHDRRDFLTRVAVLGRDPYFCAAVRDRLPVGAWCDQVAFTREICAQPGLAPKVKARCEAVGLSPP